MIGLLIPPDAEPRAVEFASWDAATQATILAKPRRLTWREFRMPGKQPAPGIARMFYDREYRSGRRLLPRNEAATRLIASRLAAEEYVPRSALILRSRAASSHSRGSRVVETLTLQDMLALATLLVLNEQRALSAGRT